MQKRDTEIGETQQQITQQQQDIARNQQLIEELKKQNLEARETNRGVVVNLPDVLFEFGKSNLTGDAQQKIQGMSNVLDNQARNRRVSVEGHTDSVGSDAYNQKLSEQRAETVATALERDGVSTQRIAVKGFGKRYPIAPNTTPDGQDNPAGRAKNRRVEVVIENN
jgi:outer membrane protein OmpA-like peptidoglycan-associated protein